MTIKYIEFNEAPLSLREEAWLLYKESFPEYERRSRTAHQAACNDPEFHSMIAADGNDSLLGIVFYWVHDALLFVEHIAVNPSVRGQNLGSTILGRLTGKHSEKTIILEIDPPVDDISIRRKGFYERLGFVANDYDYSHPSFVTGDKAVPHKLIIMSHGRKISEAEYNNFKEYLYKTPLKYIN